jgi:hypothetical protein
MEQKMVERLAEMKIEAIQLAGGKADEHGVSQLELHLSREDALRIVMEQFFIGKTLGMTVVSVDAPATKIISNKR